MKYAIAGSVSLALVAACTSGDRRLEPDELEARDLLGVSSGIASGWDADERAAAREVLRAAWHEGEGADRRSGSRAGDPASATAALAALDGEREAAGEPPLVAGFATAAPDALVTGPIAVLEWEGAGSGGSLLARDWRDDELELVERGGGLLVEVARAACHPDGEPLAVHPARGQPFGAVYAGRAIGILVNPVLLAALEPRREGGIQAVPLAVADGAGGEERAVGAREVAARPVASGALGGNPYSFFGSVEECAAYQRLRCEDCLPSSSCEQTSRGAADGNAECMTLGEDNGRGYFLYCTNLSLAIATVSDCTEEEAPSCPQDGTASNDLADLEANAGFVDDATCLAGLDSCLAAIYGDPDQDFPGPVGADAGPAPPPPEPRDTETSCSGSDVNCEFSPQCDADCSSSCDNVFSCDADCNGNGSSGGCDSCGGEDTGTSGGDSGCGGGSDSDGGGGGCGGSDSGGSGDSGCGNGCGDGGGCDGCGSGSDGGGGCNNSGGGGGSGGGCVVSGAQPRHCPRRARVEGFLAMFWSLLPLTYLERCRRRARRRELARSAAERGDGGAS